MPGLVPGIHVLAPVQRKAWMAGTSPAMTTVRRKFKSPLEFDAHRPLVRLRGGAEFGVVIDVDARSVAQAQRSRCAGIRTISAFADALEGDALAAETDGDVGEVLHEVVDELVGSRATAS